MKLSQTILISILLLASICAQQVQNEAMVTAAQEKINHLKSEKQNGNLGGRLLSGAAAATTTVTLTPEQIAAEAAAVAAANAAVEAQAVQDTQDIQTKTKASPHEGVLVSEMEVLNPCHNVECDICCYKGYCIKDEYVCELEGHSDFSIILILIYVILVLLVGIPIALIILDLLMLRRPLSCTMSFCEFMANYVCRICCLNSKYRKNVALENARLQKQKVAEKNARRNTKALAARGDKVTPEASVNMSHAAE